MKNGIVKVVSNFSVYVGEDAVFIILSGLILAGFVADLMLSIFKNNYILVKRLWFVYYSIGVSWLAFMLSVTSSYCHFLLGFGLCEGLILIIPLMMIRVKKPLVTEEAKSFINFIDNEIERSSEEAILEEKPTKPIKQGKGAGVDFSHVKNVIKKLENFDLIPSDKKEIRELEGVLYQAENSGKYAELKEKINDGLGSLLKLMAKYGA